jgi:hypothetical protein
VAIQSLDMDRGPELACGEPVEPVARLDCFVGRPDSSQWQSGKQRRLASAGVAIPTDASGMWAAAARRFGLD